ncbi:hypothetical protein G1C96_0697 [Bifidobacterium sp. DSM 109958]|uniref:Uncharacterized protein n=1 Tax=Bifidobacterium moraviense TaxID=2675323 RepID=A0A7Y0F163_9BIFI|nr:hypothetical protein [Bifidobacterium sp. DSM 109958]NMN00120.1 hypothetical protein [Bifidobacterium sp. DSM 109958]
MERMSSTTRSSTTRPGRGGNAADRRFTWNRTHVIFMIAYCVVLVILVFQTAINAWTGGSPEASEAVPTWLRLGLKAGGLGLAVANFAGGLLRRGSLTMPALSGVLTFAVVVGFGAAGSALGLDAGGALMNAALALAWFAIAAFVPYAIAHHGLRGLFAEPDPATRTGRLTLRVRATLGRDPVTAGCWIMLLVTFGCAAAVRAVDQYGFVSALVAVVVTPTALTALNGLAAYAGPRAWRLTAAGAVMQIALVWSLGVAPIGPGVCTELESSCTTLPNGWVLHLDAGLAMQFYVIPAAVWAFAYLVGAMLRRRGVGRTDAERATDADRSAGVSDRCDG